MKVRSWDSKPDPDCSPVPFLLDEWLGELMPLPCSFFSGPISYLNSNIGLCQLKILLSGVSESVVG